MENKLNDKDKAKLRRVLDSIIISKYRWNLILLIILSLIALIIQISVDILLK